MTAALKEAVQSKLELDYPRKDGTTLRQHLEQIAKHKGTIDPRLDAIEIPEGAEWLWDTFWIIRQNQALSAQEIRAYSELTGINFNYWEVTTLLEMDSVINAYINKQMREND